MKVAVIGATGRTGQAMLAELLKRGYDVSVLVRDPAKARRYRRQRCRWCRVRARIARRWGNWWRDRCRALRARTHEQGARSAHQDGETARRVASGTVASSASAVRASMFPAIRKAPGQGDFVLDSQARRLGRQDKPAEYEVFAASDLDWTLVRPPRLMDGQATGKIVHDANKPGRSSSIQRADLGQFLVTVLDEGLYVRQAPFVSGG